MKELDRQETYRCFEEWISESDPPHLIIRLIPGVYRREWLPEVIPEDEVWRYADDRALQTQKRTCLVLNRMNSVWFNERGRFRFRRTATPDDPIHHPYMTI
ncbi:hypothetical protein ACFL2Q_05255 [Thermodesulfobacteriota bacterium]